MLNTTSRYRYSYMWIKMVSDAQFTCSWCSWQDSTFQHDSA